MKERISFWGSNSTDVSSDSILPGASLVVLLRSPFLPGVSEAYADPTIQSCCTTTYPDPDTGLPCDTTGGNTCYLLDRDSFRVTSVTVTPMYAPEDMDLGELRSLIGQVCGALSWIEDMSTCSQLQSHASEAQTQLSAGNFQNVRQALNEMLTVLHAGHADETVNDNAYYLLVTDARFIRDEVVPPPACGVPTPIRLLAGQSIEAGEVRVAHTQDSLFVEYALASGWQLTESHMAPALSVDGIPTNRAGNPMIGQFPYQSSHSPAVTSHTYRLPLATLGAGFGDELLIAAHGDLTGPSGAQGAWADGVRFTDGGSWAMYFTYDLAACQ